MRLLIFWLLVAAGVGALLPPLFTHGACTAEFDAVADQLEGARSGLATLPKARQYLAAHGLAYETLSARQCEAVHLREVESCPSGVLLLGAVPVKDRVCRYYRDDSVRFQLAFNVRDQLIHVQTDMHPYRMLKFPGTDFEIDVAK
jgi:hypothetical protein